MRIAITGANSSVGLALLTHASEGGEHEVVAGVRSERAASTLPSSPAITPHIVSYEDPDALGDLLRGADCAVHLAGILFESRATTYERANVGTTAAVVEACRETGVPHVVLVGVLGADPASPNAFLRSKGRAERVVAESGLSAGVLRTPILIGPGTAGAKSLLRAAEQGKTRLLGGGGVTLRPLDIDDLSRGILRLCTARPEGVNVLELVGPETIAYRDLVKRFAGMQGRDVTIGSTPIWMAKLAASVSHTLKGGGISPDVIDVITSSEDVDRNADEALGLTLTPLAETLQKILPQRTRPA